MNHDDDEEEEEEVGTRKYPSGRNETRICIFTARKDFEFKSAPPNFFLSIVLGLDWWTAAEMLLFVSNRRGPFSWLF